jgi:ParB-like chromosome segregation protein Spo0J
MPQSKKWAPDAKAESVLNELGLAIHKGRLSLVDIDWKATYTNIGRTGRCVSQDTADDYALAMQSGAVFPMPIVIRRKKGATIVAGVHRGMASKQNGDTELECYIVDEQTEAMERLIAIMTNRKEGVRVSKQEAMEYGIHLVSDFEMDPKQIADYLGLNHSTLASKLRTIERRKELSAIGFRGNLPDATIDAMGKLFGNQKVLLATAELVGSHSIPAAEVREIATKVTKSKTEAQQLVAVESEQAVRQKTEVTPVNSVTLSIRTKFIRAMHALQSLVDGREGLEDLQIIRNSDEHRQLVAEWKVMKKQLDKALA